MSSESDDTKKKRDAAEADVDAGSTVSVNLADIPGAHPATASGDPLPELPAAAEPPAAQPPVAKPPAAEPSAAVPPTAERATGASGSINVEVSSPELPSSSSSGSVDVAVSSPAIPEAVGALESQPVSGSGRVVTAVAAANEGTGPARRARRVTGLVQDAVSAGVEKLGAGIESVGEGVTKVGDLTKKVPLVGAGVGKLGEGLTKAGESIHALPRVAQTRRGRLLVRSVVVGFLLVFSWITVIVGFQLRQHDTPDFRPSAEQILLQISQGKTSIGDLYERASPRFQELVRKEQFIDNMMDLNATNGAFREITAINETLVTIGPTGRVGRVSLTASYEKGIAHGSISFHYDKGQWKLLGIGVEVPRDVRITETEREKRVAACKDAKGHDVSDQRAECPVRDAFETILEKIRDGNAGIVWDEASDIFKQQETRTRFIQVQADTRAAIGDYKRLLNVTEAKSIGGLTATFIAVAEFERSSGVRVDADFARLRQTDKWQLRRFKIVVPMPRAEDDPARPNLVPPAPQMPPPPREATSDASSSTP
ncbi:MAG TPA: hypothetical protein VMZ53_27950 [Kofleriaceae bacterium]|nr:hypothetical protein [Kofleriaceae bacterium]